MITDVKSVQILVALLKKFNIHHLVLSPGNRDVPFVHTVENDDFFTCYSITDERSAGFFAIGLIHQFHEPVVICCTSGTAVCNYASAVNEAYYQKLPLVVITADRNPYYLNQLEDQMIPQMSVFRDVCKAAVQLPMIKDAMDEWKCTSLVNTALLELDHHGAGPVHINVPIEAGLNSFNTEKLPDVTKVDRVYGYDAASMSKMAAKLSGRRIMVLYGQSAPCSEALRQKLEVFVKRFNAVIAVDLLSNLHCDGAVSTFAASRMLPEETISGLIPDIVISVNGNFVSYIRNNLKASSAKLEHWLVTETGALQDPFHCLTTIIESDTELFFDSILKSSENMGVTELGSYYDEWKAAEDSAVIPELPYSDMLITQKFMVKLKAGDKLHLANSSSVRIAQHFYPDPAVEITCNRGTNGIDGSMSSFVGEACGDDEHMHYLLIGDLSFFYDMNALWNRYIGKNIRILLNNNEGAEIFHFAVGTNNVPTLNKHVAAEHFYSAKGWAESVGMRYIAVRDESDIESALEEFMSADISEPVILEAFTKKDIDAEVMRKVYASLKPKSIKETIKGFLRK